MYSDHHEDSPTPSGPKIPEKHPQGQPLPAGLTRPAIILNLKAGNLDEAIEELVPRALHGAGPIISKSQAIAKLIQKRLKSSKLDTRLGVVFITSRIPTLPAAKIALGISPEGLSHVSQSREPLHIVFLSLLPNDYAAQEIPLWARRSLHDSKKVYQIRTAPNCEAVISICNEC